MGVTPESQRYEDSEGRTHFAYEYNDLHKRLGLPVCECLRCGGIVADIDTADPLGIGGVDVGPRKLVNVFGYPDTGFYFKARSSHDCNVRLNRGLGPQRKETK